MKDWQSHLAFLIGGMIITALIALIFFIPQRGKPIELATLTPNLTLSAATEHAGIQVYITGAVFQPGLITLPVSARQSHAIEAAGGLLPEADADQLNLAALLNDGQKIYIPFKGTPAPTGITRADAGTLSNAIFININLAGKEELDSLPGIGVSLAEAIVQYRDEHGAFIVIEDVMKVPGIGQTKFDAIKHLITTGN